MAKYVPVYFAPDADPSWVTNPGVLTDVRNMVPTARGTYMNYTSTSAENLSTLTPLVSAETPLTSKIIPRRGIASGSGSARFFIGTDGKILEAKQSTGTIVDVSKAATTYVAEEWCFDAYGDTMLACPTSIFFQPPQAIQASTGAEGTVFADLTNAPKAALVVVQKNFVIAYNCYDGTNWYNDGWMCSGLGNSTSWAANFTAGATVSTQANYGRLLETSGGVRAVYRMRDGLAVYKADSIYLAQYTGPITTSNPATWAHRLISDRVGVGNHNCVAVVNGVHYFLHKTGLYRFDGSYPQNIGHGRVNKWVAQMLRRSSLYDSPGIKAAVDEENSLIYWFFQGNAAKLNAYDVNCALVYNYVSDTFGFIDRPWDEYVSTAHYFLCPVQAASSEIKGWKAGTDAKQFNFLSVGSVGGSIYVRGAHVGNSSRGNNTYCSLYTGDIGDDIGKVKVTRVKPRILYGDDDAQSAKCYVDVKDSTGDYYNHSGLQLMATATGTGSGGYRIRITPQGVVARTIASGDYMSFQANMVQGSTSTALGVRITFADASTADFSATITANDTWVNVLSDMTAYVGKVYSTLDIYLGAPAATGVHQGLIRNIEISDSTGAMRQRLYDANERLTLQTSQVTTNYTVPYPLVQDVQSQGREFTYDATKRRYDGTISGRLARIRLDMYNKCEVGGLYIEQSNAGTE